MKLLISNDILLEYPNRQIIKDIVPANQLSSEDAYIQYQISILQTQINNINISLQSINFSGITGATGSTGCYWFSGSYWLYRCYWFNWVNEAPLVTLVLQVQLVLSRLNRV
jgi:hypothetical protein